MILTRKDVRKKRDLNETIMRKFCLLKPEEMCLRGIKNIKYLFPLTPDKFSGWKPDI